MQKIIMLTACQKNNRLFNNRLYNKRLYNLSPYGDFLFCNTVWLTSQFYCVIMDILVFCTGSCDSGFGVGPIWT